MKVVKIPFQNAVVAKTHPSEYLMHKYWARKPHNVVSDYIQYYTKEGDVVLDPFGGSGVTTIESLKLNRKAIYNDLSPMACFIARNTAMPVDTMLLQKEFERLQNRVRPLISELYKTKCAKCGGEAEITHTVWQKDEFSKEEKMLLVKTVCDKCKRHERKPIAEDLEKWQEVKKKNIPFWYPKDELFLNARINLTEKIKVCDFFTHRALIALSILLYEINKITDEKIREVMRFVLSSSLAQTSNLVFVIEKRGGKTTKKFEVGSWSMPNMWQPPTHFEIHVWQCFENRFSKINRGKNNLKIDNFSDGTFLHESATALKEIKSESVDYIFTDPPYGDAVPYFELSEIWRAWLAFPKPNFDQEIVVSDSSERAKEHTNYKKLLQESFAEMFRVLKPNQWLTVTFHNREIKVWNALVTAAAEAGFMYENDNYVIPPRASAKSLLAQGGSMIGDIYINFRKPEKYVQVSSPKFEEVKKEIYEEAEKMISERGGQATTDQLWRGVLMKLSRHNLFSQIIDYKLADVLVDLGFVQTDKNIWTLPEKDANIKLLEYIPLHTRISAIIDSVLESVKKKFSLDEFLVPIFTKLKNGRTPETKEIIEILREKAKQEKDAWLPKDQTAMVLFSELPVQEKEISKEMLEQEKTEHNVFIFRLARVGSKLGYNIWIGKNEKNKSPELFKSFPMDRLIIPGLSDKAINKSRIDQIDLIWLNSDKGEYILFEVENSTRMINCIPRLANLTQEISTLRIPMYIVIPDSLQSKAQKELGTGSSKKLLENNDCRLILYSKLIENLDLLESGHIKAEDFLKAVSVNLIYPFGGCGSCP